MSTQARINETPVITTRQMPFVTIAVLLTIGVVTGLQFVYPSVLESLRRDPAALGVGEWWRLLSPLLVHADGWLAWTFNSLGIALVGPTVEQLFGRWRWLLLFLLGGLAGNIAGYAWEPYGAGASVGMFGLVGGLCAWLLVRDTEVRPAARVYTLYIVTVLCCQALGIVTLDVAVAIVVCALYINLCVVRHVGSPRIGARLVAGWSLLGAVILAARHNNHGPPIILAACVAALLLYFDPALHM